MMENSWSYRYKKKTQTFMTQVDPHHELESDVLVPITRRVSNSASSRILPVSR